MLVPAFLLVACCNNEPKAEENAQCCEKKCCDKEAEHKCGEKKCGHHEMSEEQKADMAAWEDWANQTDEKKAELLNKRKACYDQKKAQEAEMAPIKAEFDAKMANWDNMSLDEKKDLFDNCPCKKQKGGCGEHKCGGHEGGACGGNHEGCGEKKCGNHEGGCEHKCDKKHEGCPNHKE